MRCLLFFYAAKSDSDVFIVIQYIGSKNDCGSPVKQNPMFRCQCCQDGKIPIPHIRDTPDELRDLLSQTEVNAQCERVFTVRTCEFVRGICAYNNAVSFTPLGAKIDNTITNNVHGVYTLCVHSEVLYWK